MSFILDALKKSESDRQRQSGPSLFEVKVTPPRRVLPVWAVAIAVLLGINVVVISWMLLRRAPAHQPASTDAASSASAAPAAAGSGPAVPRPSSETAPTTASVASAARAAPAQVSGPQSAVPPAGAGQAIASAGSAPAAASPAAASAAAGSPAAVPPPPASPASGPQQSATAQASVGADSSDYAPAVEPSAAGTLPLYQQIVTSDGLPPLHLDLHVFAASPRDRFVMINMQKLVEGDSLPDGVHVDAIRPDGVVLSYHGTRFLLPRD